MSRILIVEDEEAIAELERDYLELSGYTVEIENNGDTPVTMNLNLLYKQFQNFRRKSRQRLILLHITYPLLRNR